MEYYYKLSTELYHHGIKGQKWGVRRYQNEDGTLTSLGRERYGVVATASTRLRADQGVSRYDRHNVARRRNEVRFRDATLGQKIGRTAIAAASLGTGRFLTRFAYRHQRGLNKVNSILATAGIVPLVLTGTGPAAAAITAGKAIVAQRLGGNLNDILYEQLYLDEKSRARVSVQRKNAVDNKVNYASDKRKAFTTYDKKLTAIEDKYDSSHSTLSKEDRKKEEQITNEYERELAALKKKYKQK